MSGVIQQVIKEEDQPLCYKEVFDEIIEPLNESQLNELIEEIENQKLLLKIKHDRRIKMKQELQKEKIELRNEIKKRLEKECKEQLKKKLDKNDEEDDDEEFEEKIKKPKKKKIN